MNRILFVSMTCAILSMGLIGCGKKDSGGDSSGGGSGGSGGGSAAVPAGWVRVSIPEGPCEVWMPAQPKREVQDDFYGWKCYMHTYNDDADVRGYMANVTNTVNDKQLADAKARGDFAWHLKDSRDKAVNAVPGCNLVSDKEIQYNGHPGREFQYKSPDGSMTRMKFYMIGWQFYSLCAYAPTQDEVTSKDADAFFNSFKALGAGPKGK